MRRELSTCTFASTCIFFLLAHGVGAHHKQRYYGRILLDKSIYSLPNQQCHKNKITMSREWVILSFRKSSSIKIAKITYVK